MTGSPPVPKDRTGEQVGKYRLVRRIGEGGMGEVYEARHVLVGRREAIKLLRPELARNEQLYARFQQEAMIAGELESRHIVPVRDLGWAEDGTPYMVMDLLDGQSLANLLAAHGRFELAHALDLIHQACGGVSIAHAKNIIHRDLKPENMFVCPQDDGTELVRILDFGIAKLDRMDSDGPKTLTGSTQGTLYYMSPEQAQGSKAIDKRTDVYTLGVILYELLCGDRPYGGDSYNAILYQIMTQAPKPLGALCPDIPDEVVAIVEKAMAHEPEDRFQSVADFDAALAPFRRKSEVPPAAPVVLRPSGSPLGAEVRTLVSTEEASDDPRSRSNDTSSDARVFASVASTTDAAHAPSPRRRALWFGAGAAVVLAGSLAILVWRSVSESPTRSVDATPSAVGASPRQRAAKETSSTGRHREGAAADSREPPPTAGNGHAPRPTPDTSAQTVLPSAPVSGRGHSSGQSKKRPAGLQPSGDASFPTASPGTAEHPDSPSATASAPQRFRPLPRGVPSKL